MAGTFKVYDLEYYFDGPEDPDNPSKSSMRSVLIRTGPNQFREIDVEESRGGTFVPTEITRSGQYTILSVIYEDGGIYRSYESRHFTISTAGAALLDVTPLLEAPQPAVPEGMFTYQPMSGIDFRLRVYHILTEKENPAASAKMGCCQGRVEVPFTIRMGRVIPGRPRYSPYRLP